MKRILVAPLNWGLGHAARCIPIIKALERLAFIPVIASDGAALEFLRKEFPQYESYVLPSYSIRYSKKGAQLKWKLLMNSPKIMKAVMKEHKATKDLVLTQQIDGIISDNRYGVRHDNIPSVFITHQITIKSGHTTRISSKINQLFINKFDACWIPDVTGDHCLSGQLSGCESLTIPTKHLGILSRFSFSQVNPLYDLLILLSGPEPQRSILETHLLDQIHSYSGKVLFVRGIIERDQKREVQDQLTIVNFLLSKELELALNQSTTILARSGYSTILDLAKLQKKAFFIPTPGQTEQMYLAKKLEKDGIAPFAEQHNFSFENLKLLERYSGFKAPYTEPNFEEILSFFKSERELTSNA